VNIVIQLDPDLVKDGKLTERQQVLLDHALTGHGTIELNLFVQGDVEMVDAIEEAKAYGEAFEVTRY